MHLFLRWWESLGKAERIVTLAIGLSTPVAVLNSAVWALAVAYMSRQNALVAIERLRLEALRAAETSPLSAPQPSADDPTGH